MAYIEAAFAKTAERIVAGQIKDDDVTAEDYTEHGYDEGRHLEKVPAFVAASHRSRLWSMADKSQPQRPADGGSDVSWSMGNVAVDDRPVSRLCMIAGRSGE
ncbi:hypothetical protein ACX80S_18310 [Arthrobacter sp. RHLT1-20]